MSENQKSCAFCKAYLFSDDDVVYCPVCGAPHHRDCYNQIGHCAFEELHGTPQQYDANKENSEVSEPDDSVFKDDVSDDETVCRFCHQAFPKESPRCTKCGAPNLENRTQFQQFDFLGGVDKDQEIAEGVTADEAKQFVIVNTPRYIPKFLSFFRGKKTSWNWIAFLFPAHWFFSRKMYSNGIIAAALSIIASLFSNGALNSIINVLQLPENYTQDMFFERFTSYLPNMDGNLLLMLLFGFLITVTLSVVTGIFGDIWYRRHAVSKIKAIKKDSQDIAADYRKKGGVNLLGAVICHFTINYLSVIILSLV